MTQTTTTTGRGRRTAPGSPYDLTPEDLAALVAEAGQPAYRARQVARWLHRRHQPDPSAMTDLPAGFRADLADRWAGTGLTLRIRQSGDRGDTHKFLFDLAGGDQVETVLMLYPDRATVCVSTQAGCAMGCTFCATGQFGFTRNLTAGEVVEQVARVWAALPTLRPARGAPDHITNVVFMGMGEPFANPSATWGAVDRLHHDLGLSARALTVSTVGLVPQIRRAATAPVPVNLAVSLHAPDDHLRDQLVPVNRTWPIATLLEAVAEYVAATRRRVSFEYALLAGVNDQPAHGDALGALLAGLRLPGGGHAAHVNAIPFNPTPLAPYQPPTAQAARRFTAAVAAHGVPATVRGNRGRGIDAACGQLRTTAGRPGRTTSLTAGPTAGPGTRPPSALPLASPAPAPRTPAPGTPAPGTPTLQTPTARTPAPGTAASQASPPSVGAPRTPPPAERPPRAGMPPRAGRPPRAGSPPAEPPGPGRPQGHPR